MLKRCVKTYSGAYTGYVVRHGIQEVLFTCLSSDEADKLCKQYSVTYSDIYVEHNFTAHATYRYRSDIDSSTIIKPRKFCNHD